MELLALGVLLGVLGSGVVVLGMGLTRSASVPMPDVSFLAPNLPIHTLTTTLGHVHEATTMNEGGWFCNCGAHWHKFSRGRDGSDEKACLCGEMGTVDAWR